jgi:hypothetical protein
VCVFRSEITRTHCGKIVAFLPPIAGIILILGLFAEGSAFIETFRRFFSMRRFAQKWHLNNYGASLT